MKKASRFIVKCKDEQFKTYQVYDIIKKEWVADTEDTDLLVVNDYADELEYENTAAPSHGSLYGEPCGDRY